MFIDEQRGRFGVEPICETLGVSASAYYQRATGEQCAWRGVEDERLLAGHQGRRTPKELLRLRLPQALEGVAARAGEQAPALLWVQRLMAVNGIQGAKRRGRPWRTTKQTRGPCGAADLVRARLQRQCA